jgi:transcription termination factor Rho
MAAVSEFDNLKNEAEQYAQQHPQQIKEGEDAVESRFGMGQQGQGHDQQGQGQQDQQGQGQQDQQGQGQQDQGQQDQYGDQQSGY